MLFGRYAEYARVFLYFFYFYERREIEKKNSRRRKRSIRIKMVGGAYKLCVCFRMFYRVGVLKSPRAFTIGRFSLHESDVYAARNDISSSFDMKKKKKKKKSVGRMTTQNIGGPIQEDRNSREIIPCTYTTSTSIIQF